MSRKGKLRETERDCGCPRLGSNNGDWLTVSGHNVSFSGDKNILNSIMVTDL